MSEVLLIRRAEYDRPGVDAAVRRAFDRFDGAWAGAKVLLKVNLVGGYVPERRATTDPLVVSSVARAVLDHGGRPIIADSPGVDVFAGAAERAGLMDVARELGIACVELDDAVPLPRREGATFHKIDVARLALEADAIIGLPKMKTHGQMLVTLGVKGLFGCVPGRAKAAWHYDVGLDRDRFAALLLDIYEGVALAGGRPFLTILDGIVGMHGDGPTSGDSYPYGLIAASKDALALDFRVARMMGASLDDLPLWRAARLRDMPQCALEDAVEGDFPADHVFDGVRLPAQGSLSFLPRVPMIERALMSRPVHVGELCVGCGRCVDACAAGALRLSGRVLRFDYARCIRCYCCHEMCPTRAIAFRVSPIVRFSEWIERVAARARRR